MILGILITVVLVLALLVAIIARRPSSFRVSRSALIPAPAPVVFAEVNDLHHWEAWSPWARLDPTSKSVYEGPDAGVGAVMRWKGNNQVGEGSMTIIESKPAQLIRLRLEFLKPFQATNSAEFSFEPTAEGTQVTWSMSGTNSFAGKAIGLFINCDKMCGDMFESGLANLKTVTESTTAHS